MIRPTKTINDAVVEANRQFPVGTRVRSTDRHREGQTGTVIRARDYMLYNGREYRTEGSALAAVDRYESGLGGPYVAVRWDHKGTNDGTAYPSDLEKIVDPTVVYPAWDVTFTLDLDTSAYKSLVEPSKPTVPEGNVVVTWGKTVYEVRDGKRKPAGNGFSVGLEGDYRVLRYTDGSLPGTGTSLDYGWMPEGLFPSSVCEYLSIP